MNLSDRKCKPCEGGVPALSRKQAEELLNQAPGWELDTKAQAISRVFSFDSYWAGLGFTNAVAWIAQTEKHHPDIELFYKKVRVRWSTHAVQGLSENDFICAAKVDALLS